ncbi:MAG: Transcriptional regulator, AraC family [Chthoniobacteraceae bacterium]|nr:Transcriptional regulator, AraC family [Chthoniobacteraceae bacterium]
MRFNLIKERSLNTLDPLSSSKHASHEKLVWQEVRGVWKPLHGSFSRDGISIEWHEFHNDHPLEWGRSFHPWSLEICLNFSGTASLGSDTRALGANQVAIYTTSKCGLPAVRNAGSLHRFLTIELSREFLQKHFAILLDRLKSPIRQFIEQGADSSDYLELIALPASLLASRLQFIEPPVPAPAHETWYLGRVLEILAQTIFPEEDPAELFCHRHQRTTRDRVERARYIIERDLENPPSLEMLAKEVGFSPFYLSRVFTQESGVSIPKFLRMKRVEKAAELLRTGKMNVTEAAIAVGYSSLSAFNKAFVEQMGCCPGLYPNVVIVGR